MPRSEKCRTEKNSQTWGSIQKNINMKKQTFFTILYVALIVCLIAFMFWIVFWLKTESAMCMIDPIQYYSNATNQMCYCNDGMGWLNPR